MESRMMKKIVLAVFTIVGFFVFAQSAFGTPTAIPLGDLLLVQSLNDVAFSTTLGTVYVDSVVQQYTTGTYAGQYLYTYQISNDCSLAVSFFSVGMPEDVSIDPVGYESGGVEPAMWSTAVSNSGRIECVQAMFSSTIDYGEDSATLWMISAESCGPAKGSLVGTSYGMPSFASNDLLAPAPEPATIAFLAVAFGLVRLIRRKRSS